MRCAATGRNCHGLQSGFPRVLCAAMDPARKYPALSDLKAACKARVPWFVWEYLDSATGSESVKPRNRAALERVLFPPRHPGAGRSRRT